MTDHGAALPDPALDLLWPDVGGEQASFRALPNAKSPRLLIPLHPSSAARTTILALRDASTFRARVKTRALIAGWQTPLVRGDIIQLPAAGITEQLSAHYGRAVVVGVHLGPPRANRKPVLAVASLSGELLGFAKVGVNSLTDRLVGNEARALDVVSSAQLGSVLETPKLQTQTLWAGHPLVLQSPVAVGGSVVAHSAAVAAAQVAVAGVAGITVGAQDYLRALHDRLVAQMADQSHLAIQTLSRLLSLVDRLSRDPSVSTVACGAWHGDWRPTNMAVRQESVAVWDWERFAEGVPIGFDALHLKLTTLAPRTPQASDLVAALFEHSEALLAPFRVNDHAQSNLVTTLYLLELATRYTVDDQAHTGARLGDVSTWLLPGLESHTTASR